MYQTDGSSLLKPPTQQRRVPHIPYLEGREEGLSRRNLKVGDSFFEERTKLICPRAIHLLKKRSTLIKTAGQMDMRDRGRNISFLLNKVSKEIVEFSRVFFKGLYKGPIERTKNYFFAAAWLQPQLG